MFHGHRMYTRNVTCGRLRLKCDGTRAETRFRLSAKRTSPFKSAGASVQSTTGSRGLRISGSNAGYTMFWGSVKGTGYTLHSPVSLSLPLPCVTVYHHISVGVYTFLWSATKVLLQFRVSFLRLFPTSFGYLRVSEKPQDYQWMLNRKCLLSSRLWFKLS